MHRRLLQVTSVTGHFHDKNVYNSRKKAEQENVYKLPSWQELLCSVLERIPFFNFSD